MNIAWAAVRLVELGDLDVIPALRELAETPKDGPERQQKNCGQDESGEAIRRLKRVK